MQLENCAQQILTKGLPHGSGNYGPDFRPSAAASGSPAVT